MKPAHVALSAAAGMLLTSVSVYSITPQGGFRGAEKPLAQIATEALNPEGSATAVAASGDLSRFTDGKTVMLEGRIGHPKMAQGSGETFVMLEVTGTPQKGKAAAPVNLAIVMDRSGSMKGTRIRNAIRAATAAVDRLHDGDTVSVVTFDTQVQVVVPPTTVATGSRERVNDDIRGIRLGGDTCISCGVEQGIQLLSRTQGQVNRMVVLSDGDANHGIRDIPGFRSMAQRARDRGLAITTIGVDVDYNEKVLAAISQESNGKHYFVENDEALARVFEQEAETLTSTIASEVEAAVELAPGVELDRVFDRSFRRANGKIIIPLGAFSGSDVKTVLMKVRVNGKGPGPAEVASVNLTYKDLVTSGDGRCGGKLGVDVVASSAQASEIDAVVQSRVQRSETVQTLKEANNLFEQGKFDAAKRKLDDQQANLRKQAAVASRAAPAPKRKAVDDDFKRQLDAVNEANQGFAQAPQPSTPFASPPGAAASAAPAPQQSRAGKGAVRNNQQKASDLAF
jgi:Ca-activated chloride channel homolog